MKNVLKNKFVGSIFILLTGIFVGTLLMIISFCIPIKRIYKNVYISSQVLLREGLYFHINGEHINSMLDNYTDSIMLQNAIYNGKESVIDKAMNIYRYSSPVDNPISHLNSVYTNLNELDKTSYGRYWHGYLVILKPLLLIFDYSNIRVINMLLQPLVVFGVIYLLHRKKLSKYIIPYIISILMLNPSIISLSLQFSTIFYLMNLSLIVMLVYDDKLKSNNYYVYYFLIVGMLTSFFDFLTYPLATLGMPLILYFVLKNESKLLDNIKDVVIKSFAWGLGYLLMWLGKIVAGTILTHDNMFASFLEALKYRASFETPGTNITPFSIIAKNLNAALTLPYFILLLVVIFIYFAYIFIKLKVKITKQKLLKIVLYLLISCMPFAWFIVASNHSYLHAFFTHRILIITVFGILCSIVSLFDERKKINEKIKRKR